MAIAVRSGTVTLTATSTPVALSPACDPAKSFLFFGARFNDGNPSSSQIGATLSASQILFERGSATTVTVVWYLVEGSEVTAQRGTQTMTTTGATVAISAVTLARSFPTVRAKITGAQYGNDDFPQVSIPTTTTLQINVQAAGITAFWSVVDFLGASVQAASWSIGTMGMSTTYTLPTAVTPSRTFLLTSHQTGSGTAANIGQKLPDATLNAGGTGGTVARANIGTTMPGIVHAVSHPSFKVQTLAVSFTALETSKDVALTTPVAIASTFVVSSGWNACCGQTPYASDDNPGVSSFTFELVNVTSGISSTVRVARDAALATATVTVQVVTWSDTSSFSGSSQGAGASNASLLKRSPLTGQSTSTSSTASTAKKFVLATGRSSGASTSSTNALKRSPLTGQSSSSSTSAIAVSRRVLVTGRSTGSSASTAAATKRSPIAGQSTANSASLASVSRTLSIGGRSQGASGSAGATGVSKAATLRSNATSQSNLSLNTRSRIRGVSEGGSIAIASTRKTLSIQGTTAAQSSSHLSARLSKAIACVSVGVSTDNLSLRSAIRLNGASAGGSTSSIRASFGILLAGESLATSSSVADPEMRLRSIGSSPGGSQSSLLVRSSARNVIEGVSQGRSSSTLALSSSARVSGALLGESASQLSTDEVVAIAAASEGRGLSQLRVFETRSLNLSSNTGKSQSNLGLGLSLTTTVKSQGSASDSLSASIDVLFLSGTSVGSGSSSLMLAIPNLIRSTSLGTSLDRLAVLKIATVRASDTSNPSATTASLGMAFNLLGLSSGSSFSHAVAGLIVSIELISFGSSLAALFVLSRSLPLAIVEYYQLVLSCDVDYQALELNASIDFIDYVEVELP